MKSTITINGVTVSGHNVDIVGGRVIVDGQNVDFGEADGGILRVEVTGDLANLKCDRAVTVTGNVHGDVDAGSSVACSNVGGSVDAGGSVACGNVGGNVDAGGSVSCGNVEGGIDAGGRVDYHRS